MLYEDIHIMVDGGTTQISLSWQKCEHLNGKILEAYVDKIQTS